MTADALMKTYLGAGTHAARPATPNVLSGVTCVYYETDTFNTFAWTGAAWVQLNGTGGTSFIPYSLFQARLTGTSGLAVTSADVTAIATLYLTPYKGNQIGLYTGGNWEMIALTERSLALTGLTASLPHDIFVYNNSGTITLEAVAWTNDTTRATALTTQDGVYVKSGAANKRYAGTIRTTVTTGQTEDSLLRRFVWNNYNRVPRQLRFIEETGHTYSSATLRFWNNSSASIFEVMCGLAEDAIQVGIQSRGHIDSVAAGRMARLFLGVDTGTAPWQDNAVSYNTTTTAEYGTSLITVDPQLGYHFLAAVEACSSPGVGSFDYVEMNGICQG